MHQSPEGGGKWQPSRKTRKAKRRKATRACPCHTLQTRLYVLFEAGRRSLAASDVLRQTDLAFAYRSTMAQRGSQQLLAGTEHSRKARPFCPPPLSGPCQCLDVLAAWPIGLAWVPLFLGARRATPGRACACAEVGHVTGKGGGGHPRWFPTMNACPSRLCRREGKKTGWGPPEARLFALAR